MTFDDFKQAHTEKLAVEFLMNTISPDLTLGELKQALNSLDLDTVLNDITLADIFNSNVMDKPRAKRKEEPTIVEQCVNFIKEDGGWVDGHDLAERTGSSAGYINQSLQKGIADSTVPLLVRWVKNTRGRQKPEYRYTSGF